MSYSPPCPCEIRCKCFFHDSLTNNVIFVKQEGCKDCCEFCYLRDKRERQETWYRKKKRRFERAFLKKISLKYTRKVYPSTFRTPPLKEFKKLLIPVSVEKKETKSFFSVISIDKFKDGKEKLRPLTKIIEAKNIRQAIKFSLCMEGGDLTMILKYGHPENISDEILNAYIKERGGILDEKEQTCVIPTEHKDFLHLTYYSKAKVVFKNNLEMKLQEIQKILISPSKNFR